MPPKLPLRTRLGAPDSPKIPKAGRCCARLYPAFCFSVWRQQSKIWGSLAKPGPARHEMIAEESGIKCSCLVRRQRDLIWPQMTLMFSLSRWRARAHTHTHACKAYKTHRSCRIRRTPEPHTYLSCALCATPGTPAVVVWDDDGAADEPAATSGKCCLKLAIRSSPGFCELVLWVRRSSC